MRKTRLTIMMSIVLFTLIGMRQAQAEEMTKEQIIAAADKMALAQFDSMGWNFWGRFWMDGVCFAGVEDLANVSDNPKILEAINKLGGRWSSYKDEGKSVVVGEWCLIYHNKQKEPNHADDMAVAQAFLAYYVKTKDPKVLEDTQRRVEATSDEILSKEASEKAKQADELKNNEALTWYWIDALFMAAPVHAQLSELTGNPKYLNAMLLEWKRVSDLLYDTDEDLYFRDKNCLGKKSKNGKKVFWSRGNGWVMGAFARTLPYIPKDNPNRKWMVKQFKDMSAKMASIQRPDGTWSPSLLDYEQFPYSEMSGTALNCFAMAWGINNGILDEKKFRPVVEKAWAAMLAARNDKGFLGYVQGIGAEPAGVNASQATWYGNGAFYMAAVQMAEMAPIKMPPAPALSSADVEL